MRKHNRFVGQMMLPRDDVSSALAPPVFDHGKLKSLNASGCQQCLDFSGRRIEHEDSSKEALSCSINDDKPKIKKRLDLDYNVLTSRFMLEFSKIAGLNGYFELNLRESVPVIVGLDVEDAPFVLVSSIVVTNSAEDYPEGSSLTLTELKTTSGSGYDNFTSFIWNEIWAAGAKLNGYVKFKKGFWLRAKTEGNGRTGQYLIVGAEVQ